jgi:hypothetical protein
LLFIAISPLICDKKNPKFHCLLAGGVNAREAARTKVIIIFCSRKNNLFLPIYYYRKEVLMFIFII